MRYAFSVQRENKRKGPRVASHVFDSSKEAFRRDELDLKKFTTENREREKKFILPTDGTDGHGPSVQGGKGAWGHGCKDAGEHGCWGDRS